MSTVAAITAAVTVVATVPATASSHGNGGGHGGHGQGGHGGHGHSQTVRFQTFNASLNRATAGQLVTDLSTPNNAQAATVAEIIQRTRPDVLLINEFDYVPGNVAIDLFRDNYLEVPHNGAQADPLPLRLRRAVQHRDPERLRPRQQRHRRWRQRRVRIR